MAVVICKNSSSEKVIRSFHKLEPIRNHWIVNCLPTHSIFGRISISGAGLAAILLDSFWQFWCSQDIQRKKDVDDDCVELVWNFWLTIHYLKLYFLRSIQRRYRTVELWICCCLWFHRVFQIRQKLWLVKAKNELFENFSWFVCFWYLSGFWNMKVSIEFCTCSWFGCQIFPFFSVGSKLIYCLESSNLLIIGDFESSLRSETVVLLSIWSSHFVGRNTSKVHLWMWNTVHCGADVYFILWDEVFKLSVCFDLGGKIFFSFEFNRMKHSYFDDAYVIMQFYNIFIIYIILKSYMYWEMNYSDYFL